MPSVLTGDPLAWQKRFCIIASCPSKQETPVAETTSQGNQAKHGMPLHEDSGAKVRHLLSGWGTKPKKQLCIATSLTINCQGGAKAVTSTLGNTVGGLVNTVGGVVGAATRGVGETVEGATGLRSVGRGIAEVGTGIEAGVRSVGQGVKNAGQWKS